MPLQQWCSRVERATKGCAESRKSPLLRPSVLGRGAATPPPLPPREPHLSCFHVLGATREGCFWITCTCLMQDLPVAMQEGVNSHWRTNKGSVTSSQSCSGLWLCHGGDFYLSNATSGNSAICWQQAALAWVSGTAAGTCLVMDARRGMTQMKRIIPH